MRRTSPATEPSQQASIEEAPAPHPPPSSCQPLDQAPSRLLKWEELPKWMEDNNFIHRGYSNPDGNWFQVFRSLFQLHNQTGNVYTHVFGTVFAIYLGFTAIRAADSPQDAWMWVPLLIGSTSTCLLSATYHAIASHSRRIWLLWAKLDYVGIVLQMCGGFISFISFLYQCQDTAKYCYIAFNAVVGAFVVKQLLADDFASHEKRVLRTVTFGGLFCTALAPLIQAAVSTECKDCDAKNEVLVRLAWFMASQAFGAFFFASRFPESVWPGKFDFFFHSHQIFHCVIVVGVYLFFDVTQLAYDNRYAISSASGTASQC